MFVPGRYSSITPSGYLNTDDVISLPLVTFTRTALALSVP